MKMKTYSLVRGTTPSSCPQGTAHIFMRLFPKSNILRLSSRSVTTAASSTPSLVGPPGIYRGSAVATTSTSAATATATTTTTRSDSFVDLMAANFNNTTISNPQMGLTENNSPTFLSTGNPCLDFFFHVVPDTPPETVNGRLKLAWEQDSLKALKLVCNLRGVRGAGKSDREGFYTSALWLHNHHPKTLAGNVASMADFGYLKDLLEILFRVLHDPDARKLEENQFSREKNRIIAKKVVERFNNDPQFRFLHERVSDLFAEFLRSDMKMLNSGDLSKFSLAAKWCPSLDSSFDRTTLLCETVAKKVFPREEYTEYEGLEEAHYLYHVRNRLRKEVLVPLRKALHLPEICMSANDWSNLSYDRVSSVAMKTYTNLFCKHDLEIFHEFLGKVKSGEAKIAAGALLPHQIIQGLRDGDGREVAELQWKRMVDDVAGKRKLNNCLAICDVSGSMFGIPMEVSVALGVLVSELSEGPWKGKLITFSQNPELQMVEGESLREKTEFVRRMEWGFNTDFQKVFDVILRVAVNGKLRADEMIKRLFVFSDMEFDRASLTPWETDYQAILRKFRENGYGECVPEIVFWNLRDSKATPVPSRQPGVALVSGFSKNLMSLFLENGGTMDPEAVMDAAISGEEYQKLVVLD